MPSVSNLGSSTSSTAGGLGQGIDVQQFVTLALSGDQANITQLQKQQTTLNSQTTALSQITADLNSLQQATFVLNDPLGALSANSADSSNTGIVTANAASTATPGTHNVTVNSLATTSSYYSDPVTTSSTALTNGTFSVQVGTAPAATVRVDSTNNTLDGLAATINNQNIGVRASVINDANGARLALVSNTTGAPGDLTVSANTTSLAFNKAVIGSNAALVVDGVPISSTSNTISGTINGVTLNLASANPGTAVSVTVAPDTKQATAAVNQFVASYNTAVKDIGAQFAVASDGSGGGPLEADNSLRDAQATLLAAINYSTPGNNGAVNLGSIGVNLADDGTLSVNAATLASSLASNYSGVQSFLQDATTGFAANLNKSITNITEINTGVLGLDGQNVAQSSRTLGQHILDLQAALAVKSNSLTLVYAKVNQTLQELPLLQSQLSQQLATA